MAKARIKADMTIKRVGYVTITRAMELLNASHRQYIFQLIREETLEASVEKHQVGDNPKQQRLVTIRSVNALLKTRATAAS